MTTFEFKDIFPGRSEYAAELLGIMHGQDAVKDLQKRPLSTEATLTEEGSFSILEKEISPKLFSIFGVDKAGKAAGIGYVILKERRNSPNDRT